MSTALAAAAGETSISPVTALVITVVLLALSAFFVAAEFALVAARRHRLEENAHRSASARAALRSSRELSLLLAGSQLGITLCALGLGHVSEPAVQHLLDPVLQSWGVPPQAGYAISFLIALGIITFLHMVVGEMAPKSWAISHPERSATLLALPMRAFMWVFRPSLIALNGMANWCLRRVGVEPADEVATGHNPEDLRQLVETSAQAGLLDADRRDQLTAALEVNTAPLRSAVTPRERIVSVPHDAPAAAVEDTARTSGRLRLVVRDADQEIVGVLHVRDALAGPREQTAIEMARPVLNLAATTPIYVALSIMRESRSHLALVEDGDELLGVVTLQDLLDKLFGEAAPRAAPVG
ncbi:hemolysin family protein [Allonocardiopsis opalescens]|uniref:CBS domain containing-hemolysin-like protein n=1 Tax=Allonocardiopsis opalescens TaxID=1144618 RepID=A0A2T0PU44_9ACTN|nr:hemolysin family protein [Allonocardiopsis opalescens]PRX92318.1 CBS domain containing-hemolysin-like protein [Allonocardiopsis opalescens]